jgi:glycine oxidase
VCSSDLEFGIYDFDFVADCRGFGAKPDLKNFRGVRGEVLRVHAPDVSFRRPVRLMHPRYPIYVVPRPNHNYIIGATSIESEDLSDISVRGALELMSALYSLCAGFSEARITETAVQLRPAFLNNAPKIIRQKGLCRSNGLYRHGYLASPKVAELTAALISGEKIEPGYETLFAGE